MALGFIFLANLKN